jgi:hypothetical protein
MYSNCPYQHAKGARDIKDAVAKHLPDTKHYITELNIGISEAFSLEEKAYDPKRAAALAAIIHEFHEDGALEGTFQYHIYDQWNDPREFKSWYSMTRYMAYHWNDKGHRVGLIDQNGKTRPQYFLFQMLYKLTGKRVSMCGTDGVFRGYTTVGNTGTLSVFLVNYAEKGTPDIVSQIQYENAPEGLYRMVVTRIDKTAGAMMKAKPLLELPPCEDKIVYVHPDFCYDIYTPADTVTLIQFIPVE